jgi:hypothetical protein
MTLAGGGFALMGIVVLFLGMGWLLLYLIWSPSLRKTEIGEVEMAGHGTLCMARAHDGDISYNYYARVLGAGSELEKWARVGSSIERAKKCETAVTSDSRFSAISFEGQDGNIVIYDSVAKELWWHADQQWLSNYKFRPAWKLLHAKNPRLPKPPF